MAENDNEAIARALRTPEGRAMFAQALRKSLDLHADRLMELRKAENCQECAAKAGHLLKNHGARALDDEGDRKALARTITRHLGSEKARAFVDHHSSRGLDDAHDHKIVHGALTRALHKQHGELSKAVNPAMFPGSSPIAPKLPPPPPAEALGETHPAVTEFLAGIPDHQAAHEQAMDSWSGGGGGAPSPLGAGNTTAGADLPPPKAGGAVDWKGIRQGAATVTQAMHSPVQAIQGELDRAATAEAKAPVQKSEDFIDTKHSNDPKRRVKEIRPDGTVLPDDKKPKKIETDGSGDVSKGKMAKAGMEANKPAAVSAPKVPVAKPPTGTTAAPKNPVGAAKPAAAPKLGAAAKPAGAIPAAKAEKTPGERHAPSEETPGEHSSEKLCHGCGKGKGGRGELCPHCGPAGDLDKGVMRPDLKTALTQAKPGDMAAGRGAPVAALAAPKVTPKPPSAWSDFMPPGKFDQVQKGEKESTKQSCGFCKKAEHPGAC